MYAYIWLFELLFHLFCHALILAPYSHIPFFSFINTAHHIITLHVAAFLISPMIINAIITSSKVWVFWPCFLYFLMTSWRDLSRAKSNWPMRGQYLSHCPIGSSDFLRDRSREGHVIMYSKSRDVNLFSLTALRKAAYARLARNYTLMRGSDAHVYIFISIYGHCITWQCTQC